MYCNFGHWSWEWRVFGYFRSVNVWDRAIVLIQCMDEDYADSPNISMQVQYHIQ